MERRSVEAIFEALNECGARYRARPMPEPDPRDERMWERGWDGHQLAQRRRMARLSLAESWNGSRARSSSSST